MYLTHLNVNGFKSFAHPVTIEFASGLNVIVGPNGSGKSNIIDALRWVLGDNFREMRVSQGREVIFHGAAGSKPLGMAFIETNWIDDQNPPYAIGRRLFASGESEYLFNQNRIRLKDLKETLRKFGFLVDSIGVTVVDNSKLQTLFDFRPAEKYSLFEMVSGTSTAKEKLTTLKISLNRVHEKLLRLKERENELSLQVVRVGEHARQEEAFLQEEKVFVALRKIHLGQLIQSQIKRLNVCTHEKIEIENHKIEIENQKTWFENLLIDQQKKLQRKEIESSEISNRLLTIRDEIRTIEQRIYFALTEARQRVKTKLFTRQALIDIQHEEDSIQKKINDLQSHPLYRETLEELEKNEKMCQTQVAELRVRKDSLNEQKNTLQQELSRFDTSLQYLTQEVKSLRKEITGIEESLLSHQNRIKNMENQYAVLREQLTQLTKDQKDSKDKIARKKALLIKMQTILQGYDQEGKVDEKVEDLLKNLLQSGWPRKVVYAFNWLFKGLIVVADQENWPGPDMKNFSSGQNLIPIGFLPPASCWQIIPSGKIIKAFLDPVLPQVNMISPDGNLVYRRDGVLVFPRKLVTSQSGGRFYYSLQKRISTLQKNIQSDEKRFTNLSSREKELEKLILQKKGELEGLRLRCDDLDRDKKKKLDKIDGIINRKKTIESEREGLSQELDNLEWDWRSLQDKIDRSEETLKEFQRKRFDREKLLANEEKLMVEQSTLQKQLDRAQETLIEVECGRKKSEETWRKISEELIRLNKNHLLVQQQKDTAVAEMKELLKVRTEYQQQKEVMVSQIEAITHRLEKIHLQMEKINFEVQEFTGRLEEYQDYNSEKVEIPHISDQHHLEQLIKEKEQKLKNWEVRRGSISQLKELLERQSYLKEKITYFEDVLVTIEKEVGECECLSRDIFYEFLSDVNGLFQKNFQTIFDGGHAKVEIDGQSLDIVIQIPGKKKQKLSLLSSGEKALCALCLFFSLFKAGGYRFCFFDEVDATLDHFNSVRLAELIKDFSRECQVIIVTHQEEIMEVADRIIGITMDEPGISQVVPFLGKSITLVSSS